MPWERRLPGLPAGDCGLMKRTASAPWIRPGATAGPYATPGSCTVGPGADEPPAAEVYDDPQRHYQEER